jgi:hypothetical protein
MKKLVTLHVILAFTISAFAQSPQRMSYQAVVRNNSGVLMANQNVGMKISILQGSETGTAVYVETHTKTTNANGLVTLEIGNGTIVSGTFSGIDWSNGTYFIKTETDPAGATSYTITGTSQILSVPYALYSKVAKTTNYNDLTNKPTTLSGYGITDAVSLAGTQTISGTTTFKGTTPNLEESLFDVKNKDGQTIFAVYNEGVRIWVADGAKGSKGGFAVGGFDQTKTWNQEYLRVTSDSTRIYVKDIGKGLTGGFSVGGFDATQVDLGKFLNVTPNNCFIGHQSGQNSTGLYNSFIGYQAGMSNTSGQYNSFLGYKAGMSNTTGSNNVFFGYYSGNLSNSFSNVFIGEESGRNNTSGSNNSFIGYRAGWSNTEGGSNIFVGTQSGYLNTTGVMNTFLGYKSGYKNNNSYNFFAGYQAGYNNTGNYNSFIGFLAGYTNNAGSSNVFIGERAGYANTTGNYNIIIGESAGRSHNDGYSNVLIGPECGYSMTDGRDNTLLGGWTGYYNTGSYNVMIGSQSGVNNITGSNNTFIGNSAGRNNTGARNVFIGTNAGYSDTGSDKLYIANSGTTTPLVWGDFSLNRLVVNGNSANNLNNRTFYVNGTAGGANAWYNDSDRRLKHDIEPITNALQKVLKLRGVNFLWNESVEGMNGLQMGFIGQEAAEVIPEVVSIKNDHYSMQYAPITALLVEAVKEQQNIIESQQKVIDELKVLIESIITNQTALKQE